MLVLARPRHFEIAITACPEWDCAFVRTSNLAIAPASLLPGEVFVILPYYHRKIFSSPVKRPFFLTPSPQLDILWYSIFARLVGDEQVRTLFQLGSL